MTRRRLILGAALLLLPFVVPIPEELERMRALRSLGAMAHFGLPAALALVLHRHGPLRGSVLKAGAAAFALAAFMEIPQAFVGRHPRWQDAGIDLSGVLAACGWLLWHGRRAGYGLALCVAACGFMAVRMAPVPLFFLAERAAASGMPVVADFESRLGMFLWDHNDGGHGRYARIADPGQPGNHVVRLDARPHHVYPGILARGLPRDWSPYRALVFRARQVEGAPCRLAVRLDDFTSRSDGRGVQRGYDLAPEWRTFRVDLAELASRADRPFRLDDIDSLLLYLGGIQDGVAVLIDDIRLE